MAFINEYISEEDLKKYHLNKNDRPSSGTITSWTVDQERGIWITNIGNEVRRDDGGMTGISNWLLFWNDHEITFKIQLSKTGGDNHHRWSTKKIVELNIPIKLEANRGQILKDIEEALVAYKDGGVLAEASNYTLKFEA